MTAFPLKVGETFTMSGYYKFKVNQERGWAFSEPILIYSDELQVFKVKAVASDVVQLECVK
jgi:hypothetical protein